MGSLPYSQFFGVEAEQWCAATAVCCPQNLYSFHQENCGLSTISKFKSPNALTTSMYVFSHFASFHRLDVFDRNA